MNFKITMTDTKTGHETWSGPVSEFLSNNPQFTHDLRDLESDGDSVTVGGGAIPPVTIKRVS